MYIYLWWEEFQDEYLSFINTFSHLILRSSVYRYASLRRRIPWARVFQDFPQNMLEKLKAVLHFQFLWDMNIYIYIYLWDIPSHFFCTDTTTQINLDSKNKNFFFFSTKKCDKMSHKKFFESFNQLICSSHVRRRFKKSRSIEGVLIEIKTFQEFFSLIYLGKGGRSGSMILFQIHNEFVMQVIALWVD